MHKFISLEMRKTIGKVKDLMEKGYQIHLDVVPFVAAIVNPNGSFTATEDSEDCLRVIISQEYINEDQILDYLSASCKVDELNNLPESILQANEKLDQKIAKLKELHSHSPPTSPVPT